MALDGVRSAREMSAPGAPGAASRARSRKENEDHKTFAEDRRRLWPRGPANFDFGGGAAAAGTPAATAAASAAAAPAAAAAPPRRGRRGQRAEAVGPFSGDLRAFTFYVGRQPSEAAFRLDSAAARATLTSFAKRSQDRAAAEAGGAGAA